MVATTEVLWDAFHQRLKSCVARRIENPADVDDIVQDIFVRNHERIDSVEHDERVPAWIYQLARNSIVDYYRAPRRRRERFGADAEINGVRAEDGDVDEERAERDGRTRSAPGLPGGPQPPQNCWPRAASVPRATCKSCAGSSARCRNGCRAGAAIATPWTGTDVASICAAACAKPSEPTAR